MKIINFNKDIRNHVKKDLDDKMIIATVDEVLQMKPVFRLESEIYNNPNSSSVEDEYNPIVKLGKKRISWHQLGKNIMTHEGFIIEINIYHPSIYALNRKYNGNRKIE